MDVNEILLRNYPRVEQEIAVFWKRFGGTPDLRGMRVLDFGCGLGKLCVDLARAGADEVVGMDLDDAVLAFAKSHTREKFPDVADKIRFVRADIRTAPPDTFDAVFSKDAFEHVLDVEGTFAALRQRVRRGGKMYLGFGPLWHSPFGGHAIGQRLRTLAGRTIPWAHLVIPERTLVAEENRARGTTIASVRDYGLNQLPFSAFKHAMAESGMKVLRFDTNPSDNAIARLFRPAAALPVVGKYFVRTVYCVLENT